MLRRKVGRLFFGVLLVALTTVASPAMGEQNDSPCNTNNGPGPQWDGANVSGSGTINCAAVVVNAKSLDVRVQEHFGVWLTRASQNVTAPPNTAIINIGPVIASCVGHGGDNWRIWVKGIDMNNKVDIDSVPVGFVNC